MTTPPKVELVTALEHALLSLDHLAVKNIFESSNVPPLQLIEKLVVPAMERIGLGWERGELALAQVYMSGRICEDLVDTLLPPAASERKDQPRLAIATLEDYHLLGKRMVYSVLRASGFNLLDYGRMNVDNLVERVRGDKLDVLLVSVLMLPSALRVRVLREKLNALDCKVKIIVGGAPFRFDAGLWKEVGADAMGRTASEAIELVQVGEKNT